MKIICIGSSAKDIFFPTSEGVVLETPKDLKAQRKIAFELGAKYHIEDRFESLGGCAVNQAVGLVRLGLEAACYTVLGQDLVGEWIKKEIEKAGVGSDLILSENCSSGLSAIIVDEKSGERIIFSNQEANERMKIDQDKLKNAEWISVSDPSGDWKKILDDIFTAAKASGAKVMFNPRGKNIQEDAQKVYALAGQAEILFVNKDEAIEIVSCSMQHETRNNLNDEKLLIQKLKESGAKIIVLTDGKNGAWAHDGSQLIYSAATNSQPKETTGAGDAFASGFMAAHIKGKNLEECLKWGIANSGNAVNFYGGVEGLLKEVEIKEKIGKYRN
jgi:ribokinase